MRANVLKRLVCTVLLVMLAACDGREDLIAVGTLERDRIELVSEAFESVVAINVQERDRVKAGDVIVQLDPERATIRHEAALADLAVAAARLAELESGPRGEQIAAARAVLAGAEESFEEAKKARDRADQLVAQRIVSEARRDTAQREYARALAVRDEAKAHLEELEAGTRSETLDQSRAALKRAGLTAREAALYLDRHTIRAPVDGTVEALPFELGERPQIGRNVAVMLADGMPFARVYVTEAIRTRVKLDEETFVSVRVSGIDRVWKGRLRYVSTDAAFTPFFALTEHDRGKLSWLAEIDLVEDEARALGAGLAVEVTFDGGPNR